MTTYYLEYVWLDGYETKNLRSKTKIIQKSTDRQTLDIKDAPEWGFDGSSTKQATGNDSDCILKPVKMIQPKGGKCYHTGIANCIVLCEVLNKDRTPHKSNTRRKLEELHNRFENEGMIIGIEQEYTLFDKNGSNPYDWIKTCQDPQGRYYCGNGSDVIRGRFVSESHAEMCEEYNIPLSGINAEVMLSQWEYQIGPLSPLEVADLLWLSRFLLNRLCESYDVTVKLDPKPLIGDWNGAGAHINFSTKSMRHEHGCTPNKIKEICDKLEKNHEKHMEVYGKDNKDRLTGHHETAHISKFSCGESDRGASIRIPASTTEKQSGYLEDRRPAANIDPYEAVAVLLETVCG